MSELPAKKIDNDQVLFLESMSGRARIHYFVRDEGYYYCTSAQPFYEAIEEAERETTGRYPTFVTFSVEDHGILNMGGHGRIAFAIHGGLVHEIGAYQNITALNKFVDPDGDPYSLCKLEEIPGSPLSYILFKSPNEEQLHKMCLVLRFDKSLISHALHHVRMPERVDPRMRAHILGAEND